MGTCYLLHGIECKDPNNSSISFLKEILPFQTVILSYGYVAAIMSPVINIIDYFAEKKLRSQIEPGNILIGHSNGCAVGWRLTNMVQSKGLVLINPALDADVEFDPALEFIHVYWSPKDEIAWASQFIPWSDWGKMGTTGYKGKDARVKQWNMNDDHTDIGLPSVEAVWGPRIVSNIIDALGSGSTK